VATRRSNDAALPTVAERHEWASFLALLPMFDLREIDREQYQRCLGALGRSSNGRRISRDELKARAGLSFAGDALGVDLLLARLVRERALAPIESRPFWFRVRERRCHPASAYAGDAEQSLMQGACEEQSIRLRAIHDLERRVADPKYTRKREDQLRNELQDLREIYQAAWLELENAIGTEPTGECRRQIESLISGGSDQLVLFPQNQDIS
jgi:hypothetical protein